MTKEKILTISSRLFYEKGIANVRLQQIADSVKISVGNLAYHFPNKQAIVNSVYANAFEELEELAQNIFTKNEFADFDNSIKAFFKFQTTYNFCFNNVWEVSRNYPQLHQQWKTISNKLLSLFQKRFSGFAVAGLMLPELQKGSYKILAEHFLLLLLCWVGQQSIKNKPAPLLSFRRATWALIVPYLTEPGKKNYQQLGID